MKKNEPMNMFIENKGCQTFLKKKTNKHRTSQETSSFYDWLVSILNSLHAFLPFDRLRLLHRIAF